MPLCGGASGSVRAMRMPQSATRPFEHHTFWPFTPNESPSRTASVRSEARSLPAPGSLNSWHHTRSPRMIGRRCDDFCSSVPNISIDPPVRTMPTMLRNGGTWARAHSTIQADVCSGVRPRPAVLVGQWIPAKPASNSAALPSTGLVAEVGREDRPVVTGRLATVQREPSPRRLGELHRPSGLARSRRPVAIARSPGDLTPRFHQPSSLRILAPRRGVGGSVKIIDREWKSKAPRLAHIALVRRHPRHRHLRRDDRALVPARHPLVRGDRRHLLRDLGLPDHLPAAAGAPQHRAHQPPQVLRTPLAAADAIALHAARRRRRRGARGEASRSVSTRPTS